MGNHVCIRLGAECDQNLFSTVKLILFVSKAVHKENLIQICPQRFFLSYDDDNDSDDDFYLHTLLRPKARVAERS